MNYKKAFQRKAIVFCLCRAIMMPMGPQRMVGENSCRSSMDFVERGRVERRQKVDDLLEFAGQL